MQPALELCQLDLGSGKRSLPSLVCWLSYPSSQNGGHHRCTASIFLRKLNMEPKKLWRIISYFTWPEIWFPSYLGRCKSNQFLPENPWPHRCQRYANPPQVLRMSCKWTSCRWRAGREADGRWSYGQFMPIYANFKSAMFFARMFTLLFTPMFVLRNLHWMFLCVRCCLAKTVGHPQFFPYLFGITIPNWPGPEIIALNTRLEIEMVAMVVWCCLR